MTVAPRPLSRPGVTPDGHTRGVQDPTAAPDSEPLNPAQQAVLDQLGASAGERPEFPDDLRHHLRAALETAVEPHLDDLPEVEDLYLNKHLLLKIKCNELFFKRAIYRSFFYFFYKSIY